MAAGKKIRTQTGFSLMTPRVSSAYDPFNTPRVSENSLPLKVRVRERGVVYLQMQELDQTLEECRKAAVKLRDEFGVIRYRDGTAMLSLHFWVVRRVNNESSALRWRWGFFDAEEHNATRSRKKRELYLVQSFSEVLDNKNHPQYPMLRAFLDDLADLGSEQVKQVFETEFKRIEINNLILECRLALRNAQRLVGDMELETTIISLSNLRNGITQP